MTSLREPRLLTVKIADLRPTQMTVGLHEVEIKKKAWLKERAGKQADFLGDHLVPAVRGPKYLYVIDHHHLCRALLEAGQTEVAVSIVADLSALEKDAFWVFMDNRNWLHAYDARGKRCGWSDLPKSIAALADDPYRSLAGGLRRMGGYAKDATPFSEFLWADFLRRRIDAELVKDDYASAARKAMKLAKDKAAAFLPGWCGPDT